MGCELCLYNKYHKNGKCGYTANNRSNPELGEDCLNFDYNCDICKDEGFRYYDCPDCDLTEEEYYGD